MASPVPGIWNRREEATSRILRRMPSFRGSDGYRTGRARRPPMFHLRGYAQCLHKSGDCQSRRMATVRRSDCTRFRTRTRGDDIRESARDSRPANSYSARRSHRALCRVDFLQAARGAASADAAGRRVWQSSWSRYAWGQIVYDWQGKPGNGGWQAAVPKLGPGAEPFFRSRQGLWCTQGEGVFLSPVLASPR
jgi:hypothetical protein